MRNSVLIITASFNSAEYLPETIRSVQNQTHSDWLMIICDDGSTDSTVALIQQFAEADDRIKLVEMGFNSGRPAGPRNLALAYALERNFQFSYIAYLDSDDLWPAGKLERQIHELTSHPDIDFVYSRGLRHLIDGVPQRLIRRAQISSVNKLLFFSHISLSSVMMRWKSVGHLVPIFDEDPLLKAMEDYEAWIRLLTSGLRVKGMDTEDLLYRINPSSISTTRLSEKTRRYYYVYAKALLKNHTLSIPIVALAAIAKGAKFLLSDLFSRLRNLAPRRPKSRLTSQIEVNP